MTDSQPRRSELLSRALSASAGLVALCALAVSAYQAKIMREQLRMSAWPYVRVIKSNVPNYARVIDNLGLGPALIRSVVITVDGRPTQTWGAVIRALVGDSALARYQAAGLGWTNSTVGQGSVLLPGATVRTLQFPEGAPSRAIEAAWDRHTVLTRVCYCSLYGDCWTASSTTREPKSVGGCTADAKREFQD